MNDREIFLTLLSASIILAPLGSLKSVSAFEQISDRAIAKTIRDREIGYSIVALDNIC